MSKVAKSHVGRMIKSLRDSQNLSLRDLSEMSGLSTNAISKIERGLNSPTVASLHQLSSALGVQIASLFRQDIHNVSVFVKSSEITKMNGEGLVIESLGSGLPNQKLEPFKMIVEPHQEMIPEPLSHSGEEFIYCLKGKLEYFVADSSYILEPGDRLLFKATEPHSWRNIGEEPAEVILVLESDSSKPLPHKIH